VVDIPDVITYANFGEGQLRGLGAAGVKVGHSLLTWSLPLQHSRTTVRVCDQQKLHAQEQGTMHQSWQWMNRSRVMSQICQQIWMGHVGHGLYTRLPVTYRARQLYKNISMLFLFPVSRDLLFTNI